MRVLVTGAFGFIGSALVRRLLAEPDIEVLAIGHAPKDGRLPGRVTAIVADTLDDTLPTKLGTQPDALVHLAGGGGPARALADSVALARANLHVPRVPLPLAGPMIFASSLYVYPPGGAADETTPTAPETLYGAIKEGAEVVWGHYGAHILRLGHVYGATHRRRDDVVTRFVRACAFRQPIGQYGRGRRTLDLVHVEDVCHAIVAALRLSSARSQVINIGGGEPITVADLAGRLSTLTGTPVASYPGPGDDDSARSLTIDRARGVLGWRPQVPLDAGLRAMLATIGDDPARYRP